jgi:hypothetical protein
VSIKRTDTDACPPGNFFKRCISTAISKGLRGDLDQLGAVAVRICS